MIKVGDLIKDSSDKSYGIVLELNPTWTDLNGEKYSWDFRVLIEGRAIFVDCEDVEAVT